MDLEDFAYQLIEQIEVVRSLRAEVTRLKDYERKYNELLNSSITHGNVMMGHLLASTLKNVERSQDGN